MSKIEAAIGIPTYNGARRVADCLTSIFKFTEPRRGVSIVILDDGSPDGGKAMREVRRKFDVPLICLDRNVGLTAGWNLLSRHYDCEYVVLLNDDIIVQRKWLDNLLFFLRNNKCGGVGVSQHFMLPSDVPKLLNEEPVVPVNPETKVSEPNRIGQFENCRPGVVMCPTGSIFGFSRSLFEEVGGFDEGTRQFYNESLPGEEFVLVRDGKNGPCSLTSLERLYQTWSASGFSLDGKDVAIPSNTYCLSASLERSPKHAFLTKLEQSVLLQGVAKSSHRAIRRTALRKQTEAVGVLGEWVPVAAVLRHRRKSPCVRIRQKSGSVLVTENHSMVLPKDVEFKVTTPSIFTRERLPKLTKLPLPTHLDRLDLGQYVRGWEQYRENGSHSWYLGKNNRGVPSPNRVSTKIPRWVDLCSRTGEDFCWLLGFHVAEGSVSISRTNYGAIVLNIGCNVDKSLLLRARSIWSGTVKTPTRIARNIKGRYRPVYSLVTTHKLVGLLFAAMCGRGAHNKQVPDFLYNAPIACRRAFLNGHAAGDGFIRTPSSIRRESMPAMWRTTVSRKLAVGLSILMTSLGERFSLNFDPRFSAYSLRTINHFVGHRDTKIVEPARSPEFVYDIEVGGGSHVFAAGIGPIVVHNSDLGTAFAAKGYPSYQINFPMVWHLWSVTFAQNPELRAGLSMQHDRAYYKKKWGGDFDYTNPKFMGVIPPHKIKWIGSDGKVREGMDNE